MKKAFSYWNGYSDKVYRRKNVFRYKPMLEIVSCPCCNYVATKHQVVHFGDSTLFKYEYYCPNCEKTIIFYKEFFILFYIKLFNIYIGI